MQYGDEEAEKLAADVKLRGLGLFVMADWYDEKTMEKLRILDDNTHRRISPVTGGSNVPALNDLLQTFGISLGSGVLAGDWGFDRKSTRMVNGVPIIEFPSEVRVAVASGICNMLTSRSRRALPSCTVLFSAHSASGSPQFRMGAFAGAGGHSESKG